MCASTKTIQTTPTAYDARRNDIHVTDMVIYPTRRGSNLLMTEGEVIEIIDSQTVKVRREREVVNYSSEGFQFIPSSRIVTVGTQQMVRL